MKRAIIFLDVDGVLNSLRSCLAFGGYKVEHLDPVAVGLLNTFVRDLKAGGVDAEVVISSTWRMKHTDPEWWNDTFLRFGGPLLRCVGITDTAGPTRGDEVNRWLSANGSATPHVIFDDDSDFGDGQPLFLTQHTGGLHLAELCAAFKHLTGQPWVVEEYETMSKWAVIRNVAGSAAA